MRNGLILRGGTQTGKRTSHICGSNPDNPATLRGCHIEEPYLDVRQRLGYLSGPEDPAALPGLGLRYQSGDNAIGRSDSADRCRQLHGADRSGSDFVYQIGRAPLSGVSPVVNLRDPGRPNYTDMRVENNRAHRPPGPSRSTPERISAWTSSTSRILLLRWRATTPTARWTSARTCNERRSFQRGS